MRRQKPKHRKQKKEKETKEMKKNKGFSLVELIIVIAIMAILVGVIAPQLIRYIEKANVSADVTTLDSIRSAVTYAASDPSFATSTNASDTLPMASCAYNAITCPTLKTIAESTVDPAGIKLKSKNVKGHTAGNITVEVNEKGQVKVNDGTAFVIDFDGTVTTPDTDGTTTP